MHDVLFPVQPDFEAGSAAPVRAMIDALLEALPVPVTGIARGLIVSWNAAAQEWFGFSREETIGRPLAAVVPPRCSRRRWPRSPGPSAARRPPRTRPSGCARTAPRSA